jgi:O-antigen ligase
LKDVHSNYTKSSGIAAPLPSKPIPPAFVPPRANTPLQARPIGTANAFATPLRLFAFYGCLFYIFIRFSYIHEKFFGIGWLAPLASVLAFPLLLVSGAIVFTVQDRRFRPWIGFLFFVIAAIPFSSWPGGSVSDITSYLRIEFPVVFMAGGLASRWQDLRKLFMVLAISGAINAFYSLYNSRGGGARLELALGGTIGNSNDFAAHLLYLAPFCLFFALSPKTNAVLRLFFFASFAISLQQAVNTASRGCVIALGLSFLMFLYFAPGGQRAMALAMGAVGVTLLLSFGSSAVLSRLTDFSSGKEQGAMTEAAGSRNAREYLFRKSVEYTLQKPFFGVGPGQFSSYEGGTVSKEGLRGLWQVTHNTYTQVSSECGIPAMLCYLWAIGSAFSAFRNIHGRARKNKDPEFTSAALCCMLSLFAFALSVVFLSLAYRAYFPMLTALAIAVTYVFNNTSLAAAPASTAVAPPGFAFRGMPVRQAGLPPRRL